MAASWYLIYPRAINHFDPKARPEFKLFVLRGKPAFTPKGGKGSPTVSLERVRASSLAGASEIQAQPIFICFKPKINAGNRPRKEHLIRYPGALADTRPAYYLEKNYLLIDAIMRDPSPYGKHVAYASDPVTGKPLKPIDRVWGVRFVEALPVTPDEAGALDLGQIRNHDPQSTVVSNGISPAKRIVAKFPWKKWICLLPDSI